MEERKRSNGKETAGQWLRVTWLDRQVREGQYPNVAALREEFGVSRRCAFQAVEFLRDSLNAPLAYDRSRGGYHYTDATFALPSVFLTEGELIALVLAEQVMGHYLGTPLEAPLRDAVAKLNRLLPDETVVRLGEAVDCIRVMGASSVEVRPELLADVHRAIRERRLLRIRYYTAGRDEERERTVEPHSADRAFIRPPPATGSPSAGSFLANVRGDWMLCAWDRWRDADRVFMLARMAEHRVLNERFTPRPELRPEIYNRHTFLTEHGGEPYEVVLRFDAYQARWIRERTWHPSQRIEEQADGGLVLRLTVAGQGDLMRWILGYGCQVEVLEPQWLREEMSRELAVALALYRNGVEAG